MLIRPLLFCLISLSIYSCANTTNETNDQSQKEQNFWDLEYPLTETQEDALRALDKIQVSGSQLYSTFPNLEHDCPEEVSTFKIKEKQLKEALYYLLKNYYPYMSEKDRIELASVASKLQTEYIVKTCGATTEAIVSKDYTDPPRKGVWIFESLLNQRDLVINW